MATDLGRSLTLLVHGLSKTGKSLMGASVTKPLLYMDAEYAAQHLPMRRTTMKVSDPFPEKADSWDVCVVSINTWEDAEKILVKLQTQKHPFKGVTVDSIAALQKRLIFSLAGTDAVEREHWGEILRRMENFCEGLKDLTRHPRYPVTGVVVLCPTRRVLSDEGKKTNWVPYLRGQMGELIPYIFDVTGFLFVKDILKGKTMTETRFMRTRRLDTKTEAIEAGERVGGKIPPLYELLQVTGTREEVLRKNRTFDMLRRDVYADDLVAVARPASHDAPAEPPAPTDNQSTAD